MGAVGHTPDDPSHSDGDRDDGDGGSSDTKGEDEGRGGYDPCSEQRYSLGPLPTALAAVLNLHSSDAA